MDTIFNRDRLTAYKSSYIDTDPQTHISCLEEMLKIPRLKGNKEIDTASSIN